MGGMDRGLQIRDATRGEGTEHATQRLPENHIRVHTDGGAREDECTGAGVFMVNAEGEVFRDNVAVSTDSHSYWGEIEGIGAGLRLCKQHGIPAGSHVVFFVDCHAAIRSVTKLVPKLAHVRKVRDALLSSGYTIHFRWAPGHSGITGNENADSQAKVGAENAYLNPRLTNGVLTEDPRANYEGKTVYPRGASPADDALRDFDADDRFGPAEGIPREERWQRAHENGLNPPPTVREILQRRAVSRHLRSFIEDITTRRNALRAAEEAARDRHGSQRSIMEFFNRTPHWTPQAHNTPHDSPRSAPPSPLRSIPRNSVARYFRPRPRADGNTHQKHTPHNTPIQHSSSGHRTVVTVPPMSGGVNGSPTMTS